MGTEALSTKLIKGGAAISFSNGIARIFGIGSTLLTIFLLSVPSYGLYKLVLSAFGILAAFRLSGLDGLVVADAGRFRGEGQHGRLRRLFIEYSVFQIVTNIVLFFVLFFGAAPIGARFGASIGSYLRIMALTFLAIPVERSLAFLFNINLEFKLLAWFGGVEEFFKLAGVLAFGWWLGWGIAGILWATVAASFGRFLFFIPRGAELFRGLIGSNEVSETSYGPWWSRFELLVLLKAHGKWGVATDYLSDSMAQARLWLIRVFTSTEAVALYAVSESLVLQILSLNPLYSLLFPLIPQEIKNRQRLKRLFLFSIKYGTAMLTALGVAAFVAVPELLRFVFPRYLPAVPIFHIMLFGLITTATANATASFFYAHREQKAFFWLLFAQAAFIASIGSLLLWTFGLVGAAIMYVTGEMFYIGLRFVWLVRRYPDLSFSAREFIETSSDEKEFFVQMKTMFKRKLSSKFFLKRV